MRANDEQRLSRDARIVELRRRGFTTERIAAQVGLTRQGVEAALRRIKGSMKRLGDEMGRQERDKRILALRQRGFTTAKISQVVGMTRQGVETALRRLTRDADDARDDGLYWAGWTVGTRRD